MSSAKRFLAEISFVSRTAWGWREVTHHLVQVVRSRHVQQGVIVVQHGGALLRVRAREHLLLIVEELRVLLVLCRQAPWQLLMNSRGTSRVCEGIWGLPTRAAQLQWMDSTTMLNAIARGSITCDVQGVTGIETNASPSCPGSGFSAALSHSALNMSSTASRDNSIIHFEKVFCAL